MLGGLSPRHAPRDEPIVEGGDPALRSSGDREVAAFNDEPYDHHWFEKRAHCPEATFHRCPSGSLK